VKRSVELMLILGAVLVSLAAATPADAGCEYKTWNHARQLASANRLGHTTGKHRAVFRTTFTCVCDHTCRSTCSPTIDATTSRCTESGILKGLFKHKPRVASQVRAGDKANATSGGGANCGAGYGCFIQECRPGSCASFPIRISAQPLGVGVSFTFTTTLTPLWDGQLDMPLQCDECWTSPEVNEQLRRMGQEYRDVDSIDSGGSGGLSSPWYQTCLWDCTSWMDSQGRYHESCVLVECIG